MKMEGIFMYAEDSETETLKDKVEEEEANNHERKEEDKPAVSKDKVERVSEERVEREVVTSIDSSTQIPIKHHGTLTHRLTLIKPVIREVIKTSLTQSIQPNSGDLKLKHFLKRVEIVRPTILNARIQNLQQFAVTKTILPEKPKIDTVKPILKLPLVERKYIEIKKPEVETIQKHTKITPKFPQLKDNLVDEKISLESSTKVQELDTSEESISSLEEDPSLLPVIPDIMLDPSSEGESLGAVIQEEGPVYVIVTQELYEIITMLCALVYRIKSKEGLPSTWVENQVGPLFLDRTLIERDLVIMPAKDIVDSFEKGYDAEKVAKEFKERIEGIYKEGRFRFIVLNTSIENLDKVVELLKVRLARYVPKLLIYKPKKMDPEAWGLLVRTCWGFVKSDKPGEDYNEYAKIFQEQIQRIVKQVRNKLPGPKWPKSSPTDESELHKYLKYVVINHFIENEDIDPDEIETEFGEPPIDVYVKNKNKNIAVEIETLYGRGDPSDRINELLRRYYEKEFKGQLWLVFPNQQALLFCEDIIKLTKDYRKKGLKVEPYILDISGEGYEMLSGKKMEPGLIKLVSVIKLLRNKGLRRDVRWLGKLGS